LRSWSELDVGRVNEGTIHDIGKEKSMTIKVLGPGCINCKTLERRTREALEQMNVRANVEKVEDLNGIASYGILRTPGLVIDERVVWQGGVPSVDKLKELLAIEQERTGAA
jgi:small redox-active disulfide protein 2